jgi:putative acyl-CoA dehydrogenase
VGKYWVCKRAPIVIGEAMECLGGNGYVEEAMLARLYREAPVNAIWEGSGNVICLDVLRAIVREPDTLPALRAEIALARGGDRRLDAALDRRANTAESRQVPGE